MSSSLPCCGAACVLPLPSCGVGPLPHPTPLPNPCCCCCRRPLQVPQLQCQRPELLGLGLSSLVWLPGVWWGGRGCVAHLGLPPSAHAPHSTCLKIIPNLLPLPPPPHPRIPPPTTHHHLSLGRAGWQASTCSGWSPRRWRWAPRVATSRPQARRCCVRRCWPPTCSPSCPPRWPALPHLVAALPSAWRAWWAWRSTPPLSSSTTATSSTTASAWGWRPAARQQLWPGTMCCALCCSACRSATSRWASTWRPLSSPTCWASACSAAAWLAR